MKTDLTRCHRVLVSRRSSSCSCVRSSCWVSCMMIVSERVRASSDLLCDSLSSDLKYVTSVSCFSDWIWVDSRAFRKSSFKLAFSASNSVFLEYDVPILRVSTTDGYMPSLEAIVKFVKNAEWQCSPKTPICVLRYFHTGRSNRSTHLVLRR